MSDNKCSVNKCNQKVFGKGLCQKHYTRFVKYGDVHGGIRHNNGYAALYPNEHNIWANMHNRCYNHRSTAYDNYGGRNIKVCKRWSGPDGFKNFIEDMGERPTKKHSIDRIDNDKHYCPSNCRWTNWNVQAMNRRRTSKYSKQIGVSFNVAKQYWISQLTVNGVTKVLYSKTEKEAIRKRLQLEKQFL